MKKSLQDACKLIVRDTMRWINTNKDRPGFMTLNFPAVFLFHCTHLRKTEEFSSWGSQKVLKTRWLRHNFDGKTWNIVSFSYPDNQHKGVDALNMWLQHALSNPDYWEAEDWKPEVHVTPRTLTPRTPFGTFPSLENFSFKP